MIRKNKEDIHWLEFELFSEEKNLVHGVFLRHGGVSEGVYNSLNFIQGNADTAKNVQENQKRALIALGVEPLISAEHVHGSHIEWVQKANQKLDQADGLMTSERKLALLATHADCQAVIFYDPIQRAIATVHAGWRGQVQNIYQKTVRRMSEVFNSRPEDLLVAISPSLGPKNSEFQNYQEEFPKEFWGFQVKPNYFNLWAISRYQLEESGVLSHHIQIAELDTFANPTDFFSYRREKKAGRVHQVTGCHGTLAALVD